MMSANSNCFTGPSAFMKYNKIQISSKVKKEHTVDGAIQVVVSIGFSINEEW